MTIIAILTFIFMVKNCVLSDRNIKKKNHEKILERVYNPMEKAINIFDIEFEKDKLNVEQQFRNFEIACLDVKQNYGHLIDYETTKYFNDLSEAKKVLNNLHNEENFKYLTTSIKLFRAHMGKKINEIKKKL